MIAIINIGPHTDDPMGERNYEVRINREVIATFKHVREDGPSKCLRRGADAVDAKRRMELDRMILDAQTRKNDE